MAAEKARDICALYSGNSIEDVSDQMARYKSRVLNLEDVCHLSKHRDVDKDFGWQATR